MNICGNPTVKQRIASYLADGRVGLGELVDLTQALRQNPRLSADDAAAVADLVVNQTDKMSLLGRFVMQTVRAMAPSNASAAIELTAKSADGRVTRTEVIEVLNKVKAGGISEEERAAMKAVLEAYPARFDADARATLNRVLSSGCVDAFTP